MCPASGGDVSNIWGDVSGLRGDLDECEISEDDRKAGIDISSLVAKADVESAQ